MRAVSLLASLLVAGCVVASSSSPAPYAPQRPPPAAQPQPYRPPPPPAQAPPHAQQPPPPSSPAAQRQPSCVIEGGESPECVAGPSAHQVPKKPH